MDEVICFDDSTDMTAFNAQVVGATVLWHDHNKGYGEAIKSCFCAALTSNADILVTIDGDGQHDPDEIPLLNRFKERADLALVPFLNNGHNILPTAS
jgi:glycosyltransferase involved in cell wall biosynthesis